ncbi:hypothetical protein GCM10008949_46670 [Deinococcus humi]|nr:hypothetical protein GCM10008949_46670 [Deinococcus humi]
MGERTIIAQYCRAIRLARRTIYMEHQYLEVPEVVEALHGALQRGIEVTLVLPVHPDLSPAAYTAPERRAFLEARSALGEYPNFTLVGLAGQDDAGQRHGVWIHSKLMLVDDEWGTVGSANLHRFSAFGNGELNAAFWAPQTTRAFRVELFLEHLAVDTADLDDVEALRLFHHVAQENRLKLEGEQGLWQGIVVALDITRYGIEKLSKLQ